VDLEEILALDNEHVRAKEAEVLAALRESIGPARQQLEYASRALGGSFPPELLTEFIGNESREAVRDAIKVCTCCLFDVYAHAVFGFVLDPEPFIALLTPIGERVRLKLGVIDKDEVEVRKLKWEGVAWQRGKPTGLRRVLKWLLAFLDKPGQKAGPGTVASNAQGLTAGADAPPVEPATVHDRGEGTERHREPANPMEPGSEEAVVPAEAKAGPADPEQAERAGVRQAVVNPLLAKKRWSRGKWVTEAGVSKNSVYEYLDGRRSLSPANRTAMAEALDLKPEQLPE
jgi:hypothetical protein